MLDVHCTVHYTVHTGFGDPLAEACPEGSEWDAHKGAAQRLTEAIREALGWDYAGEVARCATSLVLRRRSDGGFSVRPFETCKRRWCPVCAWRLSRRRWALLVQRLPGLVQEHGPVRWLLLTLTIRNVRAADGLSLKEGCRTLLDGFRRLSTPRSRVGKLWPATGWIRALEITFPREGEAHPHLHVLAAVNPSYFSHGYVTHAEWVRRWRAAARLDYDPVVDVRRVKPLNLPALPADLSEALGGLREVSKYIVKPLDWTPTAVAAVTSVGRIRFIEGGGWLKGVLREDDGDLEDAPEDPADDPVEVATFWWRAAEWRYRRKL